MNVHFLILSKENNVSLFTRLLFRNQDINHCPQHLQICILTFSCWWTKKHFKQFSVLDTQTFSLPLFPKQYSIIKSLYKTYGELGNGSCKNLVHRRMCRVCTITMPFCVRERSPASFGICTDSWNPVPPRITECIRQEGKEGKINGGGE